MALKPGITQYYNTLHYNMHGEHLQRVALKPRTYIEHPQLRSALKGTLAWGMARPGKAPTTALQHNRLTVGLKNAGMQTGGRVRSRTIRSRTIPHRHTRSRLPPQGPAWPWGNYLRDVRVVPMCRQGSRSYCRLKAGLPYIHWRYCLLTPDRILGGLSREVTQSTFLMKLHTFPSSDILNNPSTGPIHR